MTITLLIVADLVHPPAISTALNFAFRAGAESDLAIFLMAPAIIATLVVLRQAAVAMTARLAGRVR